MYKTKEFGRIAVLAGGPSNEREISIRSGRAVHKALKESGCDVVLAEISGSGVKRAVRPLSADVVFLALHGRFGEDGTIQKVLEDMAIPYTGSGVMASKLALDKIAAKKVFERHGILIPQYKVIDKRAVNAARRLSYPIVVKPRNEGSSIGLSIVRRIEELGAALGKAFKYSDKIIAEKFIEGREITVGILDEKPLPVIEIVPGRDFYDFYAKYKDKKTEYITPAHLPRHIYKRAQKIGLAAHKALRCRDFSRVDMILTADGDIFTLEVNTIPGLTKRSLLPKAAGSAGISFNMLCIRFLELAVKNRWSKV